MAYEYGLVLDGAVDAVGQRLALAPCLAAVARRHLPPFPVGHVGAYLEVQVEHAVGGLEQHGVPGGFTVYAVHAGLAPVALPLGVGGELRVEGRGSHGVGLAAVEQLVLRVSADGLHGLQLHAVGHEHGGRPVLSALGLATHPDADVGVALLRPAKEGGYEVALTGLGDAGRVTAGEGRVLVEELVCYDLWSERGVRGE